MYSLPRLSQIGVSVQGAEQNERYTVKHIPFGKQMAFEYKMKQMQKCMWVLDEEKRLVGADIYGVDAADLVNLLVFIINQRMTAQDLNQLIFAFLVPLAVSLIC